MNVVTETHKVLIERSLKNDRVAQAQLYQHYAKAMYNVCLRMMNSREDAEDVLQESFIIVFTRLHTFRFESSIGSWIKRVVINNCLNTLSKAKLNLSFLDDLSFYDATEETSSHKEEDIKYSVEKVRSAMQQLPEGSRMVFSLYLFEGYDHKEISEVMGITETTSKTQFMRAKRKVIETVKRNDGYERE